MVNDRPASNDEAASSAAGSEGTVVPLTLFTAESNLMELAATWGLAWDKICSIRPPPDLPLFVGVKRTADDAATPSPSQAAALAP